MITNDAIREKIYTIIKAHIDKNEQLNFEQAFEEIGIGSLHFVKIMVEIEVKFEVELDDKYYTGDYKNIGEFIDKITECLSSGVSYGN